MLDETQSFGVDTNLCFRSVPLLLTLELTGSHPHSCFEAGRRLQICRRKGGAKDLQSTWTWLSCPSGTWGGCAWCHAGRCDAWARRGGATRSCLSASPAPPPSSGDQLTWRKKRRGWWSRRQQTCWETLGPQSRAQCSRSQLGACYFFSCDDAQTCKRRGKLSFKT